MFLISPIIIVSVISFSCYSQSTNKTTVDQGLAGYWKLFEDLLDHSRNNLLTKEQSVYGVNDKDHVGDFKGSKSWLEVPVSPEWETSGN